MKKVRRNLSINPVDNDLDNSMREIVLEENLFAIERKQRLLGLAVRRQNLFN